MLAKVYVAAAAPASAARAPAARFLDRDEEVFRPREETFKPLTRTIKGTMSRAAQLDGRHHFGPEDFFTFMIRKKF